MPYFPIPCIQRKNKNQKEAAVALYYVYLVIDAV